MDLRVSIDAVFTHVPYCDSPSGPDETVDLIEVTNNDSEGGVEEFILGIVRTGEVSLDIFWHADDPVHQEIQAIQRAKEKGSWQLSFPMYAEDNLIDFDGFITGLTRSQDKGDAVKRTLTIKLTGLPVVSTE